MTLTGLKYASSLAALAICAACAGIPPFDSAQARLAQPDIAVAPTTATYRYVGKMLLVNGRLVTAARPPRPLPRYTTILPEEHPKARDYEYIMNNYGSYAGIFDYPSSDKEIGQVPNVGGQGCTNVLFGYGKQIVWIVAAYNQITEYGVLKTPIKTLSDSVGMPSSCAMDASGDLAVGILIGSGAGDIVIYKNASGSGSVYKTPLSEEYFDGYDSGGNLFADGFTASGFFALVELPKGASKFQTVSTSNAVTFPGSVQWDGTYLTVFDQDANVMYQYAVNGTKATLKGNVSFSGAGDCAQTWIVPGIVYCGDAGNDDGEVFKYPGGGSPIAILTGAFDFPLGVTAAER